VKEISNTGRFVSRRTDKQTFCWTVQGNCVISRDSDICNWS